MGDETMTLQQLTEALAAASDGIPKDILRINAEVILEHASELPGILAAISAEPEDNPGRKAAFSRLNGHLKETVYGMDHRAVLSDPEEVRKEAELLWSDKRERQDKELPVADIFRCWALTNAAHETAPTSRYLFTESASEDLIHNTNFETFGTRYHYRHLRGDIETLPDDILTTRYWRGLAAYDRIGWWLGDTKRGHEFIMWAGEQEDINAVIRMAGARGTLDPEQITEMLAATEDIPPAIREGVL